MAFVLLLVLSISTFVSVESRSSAAQVELMRARQTAIMALAVAVGELQEHAGQDRRVSAPAEIMQDSLGTPPS